MSYLKRVAQSASQSVGIANLPCAEMCKSNFAKINFAMISLAIHAVHADLSIRWAFI